MSVQLARRVINTEEYHRMIDAGILTEEERIELINGQIIEMSPIGSKHAAIVNRINKLITLLLGKRAIVSIQNPIALSETSEPEPDIAILYPSDDFYFDQHPTPKDVFFIIEVADSSLEYDRTIKLPLYAEVGIKECWIVNLDQREIEVYHSPKDQAYRLRELFRSGEQIQLKDFDETVDLDQLLG